MTGHNFKPGDVALIRVGAEYPPEVAVRGGSIFSGKWYVGGPRFGSQHGWHDGRVDVIRPLVVIDPEDREQVERLTVEIARKTDGFTVRGVDATQAALRSLITPPRIDEPGLWGVVEASCVHDTRRLHWMRHEDDNWWPFAPYGEDDRRPMPDDWDSLIDPTLVREGVSS